MILKMKRIVLVICVIAICSSYADSQVTNDASKSITNLENGTTLAPFTSSTTGSLEPLQNIGPDNINDTISGNSFVSNLNITSEGSLHNQTAEIANVTTSNDSTTSAINNTISNTTSGPGANTNLENGSVSTHGTNSTSRSLEPVQNITEIIGSDNISDSISGNSFVSHPNITSEGSLHNHTAETANVTISNDSTTSAINNSISNPTIGPGAITNLENGSSLTHGTNSTSGSLEPLQNITEIIGSDNINDPISGNPFVSNPNITSEGSLHNHTAETANVTTSNDSTSAINNSISNTTSGPGAITNLENGSALTHGTNSTSGSLEPLQNITEIIGSDNINDSISGNSFVSHPNITSEGSLHNQTEEIAHVTTSNDSTTSDINNGISNTTSGPGAITNLEIGSAFTHGTNSTSGSLEPVQNITENIGSNNYINGSTTNSAINGTHTTNISNDTDALVHDVNSTSPSPSGSASAATNNSTNNTSSINIDDTLKVPVPVELTNSTIKNNLAANDTGINATTVIFVNNGTNGQFSDHGTNSTGIIYISGGNSTINGTTVIVMYGNGTNSSESSNVPGNSGPGVIYVPAENVATLNNGTTVIFVPAGTGQVNNNNGTNNNTSRPSNVPHYPGVIGTKPSSSTSLASAGTVVFSTIISASIVLCLFK